MTELHSFGYKPFHVKISCIYAFSSAVYKSVFFSSVLSKW